MSKTGLEANREYHVVIIVTDGNCHDMEETKRQLVSLSGMPFSGVIIGVGDGDFEQMEILDADGEVLADSEGNKAIRDVVQLVEYDSFAQKGERELAMAVLGELPDQFVDYMVMKTNEKHKIYQPPTNPFADPVVNSVDTARDGPAENNATFAPPSGPVPEEFKSGPADQEAAMIQMASINTGRNVIQDNYNTGRSDQPLNNNENGVNLMPSKQSAPQNQDDGDDKLNGTGQRLI